MNCRTQVKVPHLGETLYLVTGPLATALSACVRGGMPEHAGLLCPKSPPSRTDVPLLQLKGLRGQCPLQWGGKWVESLPSSPRGQQGNQSGMKAEGLVPGSPTWRLAGETQFAHGESEPRKPGSSLYHLAQHQASLVGSDSETGRRRDRDREKGSVCLCVAGEQHL